MGLINTLLPNYSADGVAIFGENFTQVFANARPLKCTVKENKKAMEHPVETGVTITDHVVIQPVEIEFSLMSMAEFYRTTYAEIRNLYLKSTLLTVQTRTGTYENMLLTDIPHEENPEFYDAITMAMKLKEVIFVTAQFGTLPPRKVKKKTSASTSNRGQQTTTNTVDGDKGGFLYRGYKGLGL